MFEDLVGGQWVSSTKLPDGKEMRSRTVWSWGVGKKLVRMGIDDTYGSGATLPYLMRKHEIDALALVRRVEEVVGEPLGISEEELAAVRVEDVGARSSEQLEAL